MSGTFPAVVMIASGSPVPSQAMWCLEPGRPRSTGEGLVPSPPLLALTWEPSRQTADQSIALSVCSSDNSRRWRRPQTPASHQRRKRLQQVTPEPKPSSGGRCFQLIPV